jgi:hypothetical protein
MVYSFKVFLGPLKAWGTGQTENSRNHDAEHPRLAANMPRKLNSSSLSIIQLVISATACNTGNE